MEGDARALSHPRRRVTRNPWFGRRGQALMRSADGTFGHAKVPEPTSRPGARIHGVAGCDQVASDAHMVTDPAGQAVESLKDHVLVGFTTLLTQ